MDLYILNEIQKLKVGGGGGSAGAATDPMGFETHPEDTTVDGWASLYNLNWRVHNSNANWSSSGPNGTTFYSYGNSNADTGRFGVWNSKGNCTNGVTPSISFDSTGYRHMCTATRDSMGYTTQLHSSNTSNQYHPLATNTMFIRNPTDTSISTTLSWFYSNNWSAGYEGGSCWVFVPNGDYETTTGGAWTQAVSRTSGNSFYSDTVSITVPANRTIIVTGICSAYYWTSSYQAGLMISHNQFYGLNALEATGLVCDHSMTQTLQQFGNSNTYSKYGTDVGIVALYNNAAAYFGNR